ncbi:uncharacterized protein LOC127709826 [Mytilus californianus]|uniref:uncharacterized protein LOC127709826 n=1 Tax=Mytilus californianus TaxID=6549 RepID=UPI002246073B|nr:uncharacterized protein LOC127709826 [Mytilus californianus]
MTTDLSVSFYHYLCQKLGTKDLVKIRRLCHAICDYVSPMNFRLFMTLFGRTITRVSSGSKAEGLNMKKSDLDIMYVIEMVNVVEDPLDRFGFFSFLISTEFTKPGFVRLKLHYSAIQVENNWCKERDGYVFLSSEQVKKIPFSQMENHTDVILHGPCITTANESHDMAFCLRSKSWISQAQNWVLRNRLWPSCELVSLIVSYGVLFVPIGSKDSLNEDLEWRISFSVAEKHLIYSFTHIQLLSYALLKILLKEVIENNIFLKGLLCSYFIKTFVFWVFEEEDLSSKPNDLLSYFNLLIGRLRYFVKINFLPHYFIPENNLFENRFNSEQQKTLVDTLTDIYQKGIYCFFDSETVSDFFRADLNSWKIVTGFDYELVKNPLSILKDSMFYDVSPNTLIVLFSRHKLVSHRYLYTLYWCAICQHIGHVQIGIPERSNKDQYKRYNTYLPYLVMGLQKDAITGWLCLASYFFSMNSFNTCLNVIDYILHKHCYGDTSDLESHIGEINSLELEAVKYGVMNAHSISRRHFVDVSGFSINIRDRPLKLQLDILDNFCFVSSPLVYTYFLRFMCFFHLGDYSGVRCALRDLQRRPSSRLSANEYCLGLAYYTLKEYHNALSILVPYSEFVKSNYNVKNPVLIDHIYKLGLVIRKLKRELS